MEADGRITLNMDWKFKDEIEKKNFENQFECKPKLEGVICN